MKIFLSLAFAILFSLHASADQAPTPERNYEIIDDSVYFIDGRVISFEEFNKENQGTSDDTTVKSKNPTKENTEKENGRIISNWKFYTIMLAFPIILIIIFILVFIRGKKKK